MDFMQNNWLLGGLVLAVLYVVTLYNRIIGLRQKRLQAFSDIDVQLRQRLDTLPNLVEVVKGYAAHERGVFEAVTNARSAVKQAGSAPTAARLNAENNLTTAVMGLYAVAENYPQLKADQNYMHLQGELVELENKLSAARRFFNNATSEYNTAVLIFPANLLAKLFGFGQEPYFELPDGVKDKAQEPPVLKMQ